MTLKTALEDSQLFRLLDEDDQAILADMAIRRTYAEGDRSSVSTSRHTASASCSKAALRSSWISAETAG